jgi:spore coat protein U-like protein
MACRIILVSAFTFLLTGPVFAACTVGTTSMNFGNYDVFSITPLDSTSNISISCSASDRLAITTIGPSPNSGGFNPRQMKRSGGADLLNYNVYTNAARTTIWGDGTGGTSDVRVRRPPGRPRPWSANLTVYGRVPQAQDVSIGAYSDLLTVTVTP